MELSDVISKRRSIRKYKPAVPDIELIKECIDAANHAPSSKNSQPWKFVIVKDKQIIEKLSKAQIYSNFLKNAPMVIVALSDENKSPNHFVEDCSCAIMLLMLQAAELGLGTCWNAVYHPGNQKREDYVRDILKIPRNYRVIVNIGIGYPAEKPGKKEIKGFEEAAEVR